MAFSRVHISIDEDLRDEVTPILKEMGLTLSGAIELFLRAVAREKGLPFHLTTERITNQYGQGVAQDE